MAEKHLGFSSALSRYKAATPSRALHDLPENQRSLGNGISGLDCVDEFNEIAAYLCMNRSSLPKLQRLPTHLIPS